MAFSSKYQSQIDDLYNQLANRNFSYDYTSDPLYQQYATQYTKNGQKAMEDTYGMIASRTGGLGSSYADVAAQNAYGNYMSELAAKIPELEELARSNFNSETDRLNSNLSNLLSMRDAEYNNYWAEQNYQLQLAQLAAEQAAAAAKTSSSGGTKSGGSTPSTTSGVLASYSASKSPSATGIIGSSNKSYSTYLANKAKSSNNTSSSSTGGSLSLKNNVSNAASLTKTTGFTGKKKK